MGCCASGPLVTAEIAVALGRYLNSVSFPRSFEIAEILCNSVSFVGVLGAKFALDSSLLSLTVNVDREFHLPIVGMENALAWY
jgi:hypothetical protein